MQETADHYFYHSNNVLHLDGRPGNGLFFYPFHDIFKHFNLDLLDL